MNKFLKLTLKISLTLCLSLNSVLILTSCAHHKKEHQTLEAKREQYSYKNYDEIRDEVHRMIERHNELSQSDKEKLEDIISKELETLFDLKKESSKITQQLMHISLVKSASLDQINTLKKQYKINYQKKVKVFFSLIDDMKKVIGIKEENNRIMHDLINLGVSRP